MPRMGVDKRVMNELGVNHKKNSISMENDRFHVIYEFNSCVHQTTSMSCRLANFVQKILTQKVLIQYFQRKWWSKCKPFSFDIILFHIASSLLLNLIYEWSWLSKPLTRPTAYACNVRDWTLAPTNLTEEMMKSIINCVKLDSNSSQNKKGWAL